VSAPARYAVKAGLTADEPPRVVENGAYLAFGRRVIAAAGRRVAAGDVDGLAELAALAGRVDDALATAVTGLRAAGYSWSEIATRLGISRQAAHQRWGHLEPGSPR
jgi:DNA-directed RNA polymerase specialized sigma24 family protein